MSRHLQVLCRRDPSKDRQDNQVHFEGYEFIWPDGRPVAVGLDAFCKHGQRLLSLGRHLAGRRERLIEMICFPQPGRDADMTRLPGQRVRRFFLERRGRRGRIHFLDGTPTALVFSLDDDELPVLHWIGLSGLADGQRQWFDFTALSLERPAISAVPRKTPFASHALPRDATPV
jgi:hypothetical protein